LLEDLPRHILNDEYGTCIKREENDMQVNARADADYAIVTQNQQATWSSGDFNEIARQNMDMAEALCRAVDPHPGQRVLDVACGSGNVALVVARRYCEVTGLDYVPTLIERARARAMADGWGARFIVGDAQELPFPDASFDVVLSVYGVQFAPDQEKAANEMLRVCRSGGIIGLAGPIPEGWSGDFFALHGKYNPPPPGIRPPLEWGTPERIEDLFGDGSRSIELESRTDLQYYRSVDHAVEVFSTYFGPSVRALEAIGDEGREAFLRDMRAVFERYNQATAGTAIVENRYLQTIVVRA
jgi:SAM-dependent methyltransferase